MTSSLERLATCDPHSNSQQFRWTSKNRILNTFTKKCLGVGSKTVGKKLQWLICEDDNVLQKWECHRDALLGLKNESLYLAVNDNGVPVISKDTGMKSKWTIQGTLNNICSKPYEELYTIDGNAFGRPCQFPFLYEKKWYADCTNIDEQHQRLWCSIETNYGVNQLWGYCPTRDNAFWVKHPLTNVYYQVNSRSALTWYQARKSCQQQGGELLSVSEPHEHTFVAGTSTQSALWTGLNKLDVTSGWQWSNGQPLRYLKWLSGYPTTQPGYSCGVLKNAFGSEWSNEPCSEKHGYVCQRVVDTGFCHSPWIPYSSNCYLLHRTKQTWLKARDSCLREGGDLLSILSKEEQSFVITQLGYLKTDELWIGFNDRKTQMLFEWSDQSSVPFASWEVSEPSHIAVRAEDCVLMRGEEGKWADDICENKYGFICKKKASSKASNNDTVVTSPGCKTGWTRYGYYCYMAGSESKTFEEAKQMCEKADSQLVDISSRVENAFLVSVVGARPEKYFWIGLSNQKDLHTFEWTNTKEVSFTHFNAGMPGRKQGCVAMTTGIVAGLWDVISCSDKQKYICKQKADGLVTTLAPPTTPALSCPEEWTPLLSKDFCVKYFNVPTIQMKTWDEALVYCRELGGDLLSIHHEADIPWKQGGEYYVSRYTSLSMHDARTFCKKSHGDLAVISDEDERVFLWHQAKHSHYEFIIGLIVDLDGTYQWMDGSPVVYQAWEANQPAFINSEERCVKLTTSQGLWETINCGDEYNFFCKRSQSPPMNATVAPTQQPKGGCNSNMYTVCFIYYITFAAAFLSTMIREKTTDLWIGFSNLASGRFKWTDGSTVTFTDWAKGEPQTHYCFSDKSSGFNRYFFLKQECVFMSKSPGSDFGKWVATDCNSTQGFICNPGIAPVPTEVPKAFVKLGNSSFKVIQENLTWSDANSRCEAEGAHLASIRDLITQAYLELQVYRAKQPMWIGLSSVQTTGYFLWANNWPMNMEKWASSEPRPNRPCAYMDTDGEWKTTLCNQTYYSVCEQTTDIPPTVPAQHPGNCPQEDDDSPVRWIPFKDSCYSFVMDQRSWSRASRLCMTWGASLVSIRDEEEQKFIENNLMLVESYKSFWIGLFQTQKGHWLWADDTVVDYTNWGTVNDYEEDYREHFWNLECALISSKTKKWGKKHCDYSSLSFICKTAKGTYCCQRNTGLLISILGALAFMYYRSSKRQLLSTFENPMYNNRDAAYSDSKDDKTLIGNIEIGE
uniref:Mannose receptor, C type 1b n=1 Tax=Cyprinus carpio carpio TaxID=630221 RepID=A0A8C1BP83_CYPCA